MNIYIFISNKIVVLIISNVLYILCIDFILIIFESKKDGNILFWIKDEFYDLFLIC